MPDLRRSADTQHMGRCVRYHTESETLITPPIFPNSLGLTSTDAACNMQPLHMPIPFLSGIGGNSRRVLYESETAVIFADLSDSLALTSTDAACNLQPLHVHIPLPVRKPLHRRFGGGDRRRLPEAHPARSPVFGLCIVLFPRSG